MKKKCKKAGCYEPADCRHGYCASHCNKGHKLLNYSARQHPRTNEPHIGVEIEAEFATTKDRDRALPLKGHHDGSLKCDCSAEFKVLAPVKKIVQKAATVAEEVWLRRGRISKACGLHVHLDVRLLRPTRGAGRARIREFLAWAKVTEEIWFSLVPPSRRDVGDAACPRRETGTPGYFCRKLPPNLMTSHFTWLNSTGYYTVEIRLHGGTLNPYKIRGWITALIHLQEKMHDLTYTFPTKGTPEEKFWAVFAGCPEEGKEYLESRRNHNGVVPDYAYESLEAATVAN